MSVNVSESPFRSKLYTKEDMLGRFNYDCETLQEEGWALANVVWSPDSTIAIVSFTRLVQPMGTLASVLGQGLS